MYLVYWYPNEEFVKFWKWIDGKYKIVNLMVKRGKGGGWLKTANDKKN
jgi:hypothetical protein